MHLALPQKSLTIEQLAQWITENQIEQKVHEEQVDYTEEEIQEFEHKSSVASRAIDRLMVIKKTFTDYINDGVDIPTDVTIPETKGLKALHANREYADAQIELGYRIIPTTLYGIPCDANGKICFFDVEGDHWEQYDYKMNPFQQDKYGSPLFTDQGESPLI